MPDILDPRTVEHYFDRFAEQDDEYYVNTITNKDAAAFMGERMPLFVCPDRELEKTYYFRWWVYRKHIRRLPDGYVVTEFLPPVPWAGTENTIILAAGQHILEGRWMRDTEIMEDYATFWYQRCREGRYYTTAVPFAVEQLCLTRGDYTVAERVLDGMVADFRTREKGVVELEQFMSRRACGLFWNSDNMDGGEYSIGGDGYRPYCNCAMYGNAAAISRMAAVCGRRELEEEFAAKAAELAGEVRGRLWNPEDRFFEVLRDDGTFAGVRELYGYAPWYFGLPVEGYEDCWDQLMSSGGFLAPYGLTYPEQRHRDFQLAYSGHDCQWNGPSWPYATTITLTAMANLLTGGRTVPVDKNDFFRLLVQYARSQRRTLADGSVRMWIDENQNPYTGEWISRAILRSHHSPIVERGKDYNHSTFADLIISGLVGLRPEAGEQIVLRPLLPEGAWNYFCLDGVPYRGHTVTVVWDRDGRRFQQGAGLTVWVDGRPTAHSDTLTTLAAPLSGAPEIQTA